MFLQEASASRAGLNANVIYEISISNTMTETTYTRFSILMTLSALGGLMYTLRNVGNAFNRKGADFS